MDRYSPSFETDPEQNTEKAKKLQPNWTKRSCKQAKYKPYKDKDHPSNGGKQLAIF